MFSGPDAVANIIVRITGGHAAYIGGARDAIVTTIPNANLFLLSPAGIFFGWSNNSSVDLQGSFIATTANYLRLADGGRFGVDNPAGDLLTGA